MAVCESCGERIQDGLTICPECGRPVKKMQSSLGLKGENGKKPVKTTAYNPADQYGDVTDSNSVGGSEPITISKDKLNDYKETTRRAKKRRGPGVIGWMVRLVIIAAIGYGVYYLFMNVILKPDGPETYEDAFALMVENNNSKEQEKMLTSLPPYITDNLRVTERYFEDMHDADYELAEIMSDTVHMWTAKEVELKNDDVQLEHGKNANIKEGVTFTAKLKGYARNPQGNRVARYVEVEMSFVKIRGVWYFDIENYDTSAFTKIAPIN